MIIKLLIDHYTEVIEQYKINQDYWYLLDEECSNGLCDCAQSRFGVDISGEKWLKDNKENGYQYWYDIPENYYSFEHNIECLEYRLNLLKQIYENQNSNTHSAGDEAFL